MIARRHLLSAFAAAVGGAAVAAQPAGGRPAYGPRDLNGLWTNDSGTPLQREKGFNTLAISEAEAQAYERSQAGVIHPIPGDDVGQDGTEWFQPNPPLTRVRGQPRTSLIVEPADGRLPYSAAGRVAVGRQFAAMGNFSGPEARPAPERCLIGFGTPAGAPMLAVSQTNNAYQFVQTRDFLAVRAESNNDLRIISLTPGSALDEPGHPWMGVSHGRWEGDTLVVETTRTNPGEALHSLTSVLYISPEARVEERFTRISPGEILYGFSVTDPAIYTATWRGELVFQALRGPIYEYACHEGNYSLPNILAGARRREAEAGAKAAASAPR